MNRNAIAARAVYATFTGQWIAVSGHAAIDSHPPEEREFVVTELHVDAENNLPKALNDKARRRSP